MKKINFITPGPGCTCKMTSLILYFVDQDLLFQLEKEKVLVFTPARRIGGKRVVCYDDRYVLKLAVENNGIVVSNDNYRDLIAEKNEFKRVVEERLLMYSFVNDRWVTVDHCFICDKHHNLFITLLLGPEPISVLAIQSVL